MYRTLRFCVCLKIFWFLELVKVCICSPSILKFCCSNINIDIKHVLFSSLTLDAGVLCTHSLFGMQCFDHQTAMNWSLWIDLFSMCESTEWKRIDSHWHIVTCMCMLVCVYVYAMLHLEDEGGRLLCKINSSSVNEFKPIKVNGAGQFTT